MSKTPDLNDQLILGTLPTDPMSGAKVIAQDVPRVLTVRDLLQSSQERAFDSKKSRGCTTGNFRLDQITGGLRPGFVWVFGAETSWGKSSFLVMIADENIKLKRRVLIVSSEDSESIYGDRLMLRRSRVNANRLREGKLTREEQARVTNVYASSEDSPVFLDARGRGVEWICLRVKELIREYKVDVVAYDYLQAFDNEKAQQDRRNQVTYLARVLTDSIKTSGVTGIIFSQIPVSDAKSRPDKHSIRDSRDASHAAEVVMLGHTPEKAIVSRDGMEIVAAGQRCILVDKCKDGPRGGYVPMAWDDNSACFDTAHDPETERIQGIVGNQFDEFADNDEDRYR